MLEVQCSTLGKSKRGAQLRFLEAFDRDGRIVTDNCDRDLTEAAGEEIAVRVEIGLDVSNVERHAGS
jgi:hypothetical protein